METFAYLPAGLHVPCRAVCKSCSAIVTMVPFQFVVAVVGIPRRVHNFLVIRRFIPRKLGQPLMKADQCLIVRFEAGVFCAGIRLGALEIDVSHLLHEKYAGVMYRIKNYAGDVLVEDAPLSTTQTAPFRCSGISVSYVNAAKLGFARRRGDCESCRVFVLRFSGWKCQKVGQVGSKVYST